MKICLFIILKIKSFNLFKEEFIYIRNLKEYFETLVSTEQVIPQICPRIFTNQPNSSLNFAKYLFIPRIYKMSIKLVPLLSWSVNGGDVYR